MLRNLRIVVKSLLITRQNKIPCTVDKPVILNGGLVALPPNRGFRGQAAMLCIVTPISSTPVVELCRRQERLSQRFAFSGRGGAGIVKATNP